MNKKRTNVTRDELIELRLLASPIYKVCSVTGLSRQVVRDMTAVPTSVKHVIHERSKGVCESCGGKAKHIHHCIDKMQSVSDYDKPENMLHLCPSCHGREDSRLLKRGYRTLSKKNIKENAIQRERSMEEQMQDCIVWEN